MKRATGSNHPLSAQKVSIQLALDGHSFSTADLPDAPAGDGTVEMELLTGKTMLVPAEAFDAHAARMLLAGAGISVGADECVVSSDPQARILALMAIPSAASAMLHEKYGQRGRFSSPLLHDPSLQRRCVWIYRNGRLLYIKVYDDRLQLAEVIDAPEEADIVYFIERLETVYPAKKYTLLLAGENSRALGKLIGKRFKETLCE